MKQNLAPRRIALGLLALLAALPASAETVIYTAPQGLITSTLLPSTNGTTRRITSISANLRLPLPDNFVGRARGTLSTVTGNLLNDSTAGWSAGALSQASAPYFLHVLTGNAEGTWWQISASSANTSTALTVLSNASLTAQAAGIAAGDTYEIVPADTLATFLDGTMLRGGMTEAKADYVTIGAGPTSIRCYYDNVVGYWRSGTSATNRNNTVIRPDTTAIRIYRLGTGSLDHLQLGAVTEEPEAILAPAGSDADAALMIGQVHPVSRTLASFQLHTAPGFRPRTGTISIASTDRIRIMDNGTQKEFHYNATLGHWYLGTATTPSDNYVVPFGSGLLLVRGTAPTGATVKRWMIPETY